ncbi:hypothetical protein [Streptomyces sp. NPDC001970]
MAPARLAPHDAGVALLQVKSFGGEDSSMDSPGRVVLDVTLWK